MLAHHPINAILAASAQGATAEGAKLLLVVALLSLAGAKWQALQQTQPRRGLG